MIPFNKPYFSGRELKYLEEVCHSTTMSGNGDFTKKCHTFFEQSMVSRSVFLPRRARMPWRCVPCFAT